MNCDMLMTYKEPNGIDELRSLINRVDLSNQQDWAESMGSLNGWQKYVIACAILEQRRRVSSDFALAMLKNISGDGDGVEIMNSIVHCADILDEKIVDAISNALRQATSVDEGRLLVWTIVSGLADRLKDASQWPEVIGS